MRLTPKAIVSSLALGLTAWTSPAVAQSIVRAPYLQTLTPTSVYVVWRTDVATESRVRYGTDLQGRLQTADLSALVTQHEVLIQDLQPNTRYYYSVGTVSNVLAGGDSTYYFETAPTIGAHKKFRAWVLGDSGYGGNAPWPARDAMLNMLGADRPQLFLHMGDMAYNSGTDAEFTTNFFAQFPMVLRNAALWPTFGNHEAVSADSVTQTGPYYTSFILPKQGEAGGLPSGTEAYYSFDYANVHFVVLDSYGSPRNTTGAMLTWLRSDLAATNQDWTVAYFHYPPYTRGSHDSDTDWMEVEMRENVAPILEAGGVDLVLSGHSHIYERSFLLNGAYDTPTTAAGHILDQGNGKPLGDGPYIKSAGNQSNDGTVYVVAGHGVYVGGSGDHPVMQFSEIESGSCVLDVQDNRLSLSNIRYDGAISDRFAMIKGPGLVVGAPDGAERIARGGRYTVRWATSGNIPTVQLDYSLNNGVTWTALAGPIANTGRYLWTLPATDSTQALIRVSDAANALVSDESNASFTIQSAPQTSIFFGDYWTYHDGGVDLGTAWRSLAYDDANWSAGYGQLGYGDGDEGTVLLKRTPVAPSAYFRKIVPIDGVVQQATLKVNHDDGIIVWVNGNQVLAKHATSTAYSDYATEGSRDNEASTVTLGSGPFVVGNNVIAAMVKQSLDGPNDLSFDLELTLTTAAPSSNPSSGSSSTSVTTTSASSTSVTTTSASSTSVTTTSASSTTATSSSSAGSGGAGGAGGGGTPVCVSVSRGVLGTVRDATIWQLTPNYNDSTNASTYTGNGAGVPTAGNRATALWFDLSFIPIPSTVLSATLTLNQGYKLESSTVRVHEVFVPWTEATVTWGVLASHWDPLVAGTLPSGNNSGDRTASLTDLVQDWANGVPNYGILLEEDPAYRTQWRSSEDTTVARRPRLQVCYVH